MYDKKVIIFVSNSGMIVIVIIMVIIVTFVIVMHIIPVSMLCFEKNLTTSATFV